MPGVERISNERHHQIFDEGYDTKHDEQHHPIELMDAAWCYMIAARRILKHPNNPNLHDMMPQWPWEPEGWKPSEDPMRNMEKAGALMAAAMDRLEEQ